MAHGIDRIAGAVPAQLEFGYLELRPRADREAQHGETVRGRGVYLLGLVGHLRGGHEDQAVEVVLGEGILGGSEMPEMHGVEASA